MNASWAQKPEEQKDVRVVVKMDDGDDETVVKPDDGLNTSVFAFSDATIEADDVVVFSEAPVAHDTEKFSFGDSTFVYSDDEATAGTKAQINVVLKNDDSTISVSADSVDEAIKKIQEQIKVLKSKSPGGEKAKAQQEALERAAKELQQLAKSPKGVTTFKMGGSDGSGGFTTTRNVMIRKVDDVKSAKTLSPEKKAEIDKMRSRIKELQQGARGQPAQARGARGSQHVFSRGECAIRQSKPASAIQSDGKGRRRRREDQPDCEV